MSFEQFKTQVLLLHSDQSALDKLSSGFNDRFTVHCATSGSEALNTLGSTQIDVIVTTHELPGMSGLEALREAKKRSPDTVGILLAGPRGNEIEALVGDQEVFQIVRGSVSPDALTKLIENATQQARLIALAESANDTTASPDVEAEHIVMETSENGSAIITGGTGRFPAIDPQKISAAADVGTSSVDVLVLTHDEEFLSTVKDSARGLHNVIYANTVSQADEAIRKHKIGVAVVDAAMVGTNVEKMVLHLRSQSPRLVAIVAGRRDDGEMLMDLINRGRVYRFLLKPVSPGRARLAIEASAKHHLEAPDSAFKVSGQAAAPKAEPKPAAARPARPAATPAPKPGPTPEATKPKPGKQAAPQAPRPRAAPPRQPSAIVPDRNEALSPVEQGLGDAFGGSDTSFTDTMTGIVETVTRKFRSKENESRPADESPGSSAMGIEHPAMRSAGSLFGGSRLLQIGAVLIVIAGGLGFWLFGGQDLASRMPSSDSAAESDTRRSPGGEQAESILQTEVVIPEEIGIDELIDEARLAADSGRVYSPAGNNAIELYLAALDVAPGDPVAQIGLDETIEQALGMAESAMLESRVDEALAALEGVELGDPGNARLAFLRAQLAQMQLRDYLDNARAAIRDSRYEDAQSSLRDASRLDVDDRGEIAALEAELNAARGVQRVDEVLALANARLDQGRLTAPPNDNARYYFELALNNDPGNPAARRGLDTIAGKLVGQARQQIDAGNYTSAEALLVEARRLDPSSSELASASSALQAARDRRAREVRAASERAAAERRAEQGAAGQAAVEDSGADGTAATLAAAERAAAERRTAELASARRNGVDLAPTPREKDEAPAEKQPSNPVKPPARDPEPVVERSSTPPADNTANSAPPAATQVPPVTAEPVEEQRPVAASSLKRTRYVAPKYPRVAQRRGISGWVDLVFTVDIDGTVTDVSVRDSDPGDTFVKAATHAVERWEFEPVVEDGVAIRKQAAVRMMFAIE